MQKLFDDVQALVGIIEIEKNGDEFVAAQASEGVVLADREFHAVGDGGEEPIADSMAVLIVDALEVIEVEADDREHIAAARGLKHRMMETIAKKDAIRQSGEESY